VLFDPRRHGGGGWDGKLRHSAIVPAVSAHQPVVLATVSIVAHMLPPPKTCAACGRTMEWRAAWAKNWAEMRFCSERCRRRRVRPIDEALEAAIRSLLDQRPRDASICLSEAARAVNPNGWEALMEPARAATRRLVAAGEVQITQGGRVVDPSTCKGPIRIRRNRNSR
jgi:hypothetical protein